MALVVSRPMEIVEVPTNVALDEMLKKLGLPSPQYRTYDVGKNHFQVEVLFYPYAHFIERNLPPHSVMGSLATSVEEVRNFAAKDAINYMATDLRKVLKDYSYDEV